MYPITSRIQGRPAMKLVYILPLSLFVAGVSSLPIHRQAEHILIIVNPRGFAQELLPVSVDSSPASDARSGHMDLQVDLPTRADILDDVSDGENIPPISSQVLDTIAISTNPLPAATAVPPSPNAASRLISPLIIASCIVFSIFLAVIVVFSWLICRYGRNAKRTDDEEQIIGKSTSVAQASFELKATVFKEEQIPRAPSSKRFKRYASGRVPSGAGPILTGPLGKHSQRTSRRPSPLRHVYSASTFNIHEVPDSQLCSDSVAYSCSDASSTYSAHMPPTPDLDDVGFRGELFDLDDPFACRSPCIPIDSPRSSRKPTACAEQDISNAYDSCWIIGEYADTDDEDDDSVCRGHAHSQWYAMSLGDTE